MAKFKFLSKKKRDKISLLRLSETNVVNGAHIEIFSNRQILIEGVKSVCDYKSDYIKLKTDKGYIAIIGNRLDIAVFGDKSITVNGIINNIELLY